MSRTVRSECGKDLELSVLNCGNKFINAVRMIDMHGLFMI